jgi:hypothetical protein
MYPKGLNFVQIFISVSIGFSLSTIMQYLLLVPSSYEQTGNLFGGNFPKDREHNNPGRGFHPVHIYYGPVDAIKNLKTSKFDAGSQVDQDKIILALLQSTPSPYFIDLAANDALELSNTLQLEANGWRGLCIEPNPIYWFRLAHRKCDIVGAFVGEYDLQLVDVSLDNKQLGGIIGNDMDNKRRKSKPSPEKRYTVSLLTVFKAFNVPKTIDYMSLDIEGAEKLVMDYFPFDEYIIKFLTIERPKPELQALLKSHGYKFVQLLIYWGETLWVHESVQMSREDIQAIVAKTRKGR